MNELPEDVPALSAEASEFLKRHATTGEPSLPALQRVKARLPTPRARLVRFARIAAPFAAALVIVVGSAWFWSQRARPTETPPPARAEPAIPVMTLVDESKPEPMPVPAPRADPKRDELREVYLRAYMLRETDPAQALRLFQRIVAESEPQWEIALKAQSRIKELGGVARPPKKSPASTSEMEDLFQRAYVIRDRSPEEAAKMFRQIIEGTDPSSPLHQRAQRQLDAMPRIDPNDFLRK